MSALLIYRGLTEAAAPFVRLYLDRRVAQDKEDPARISERFGVASRPRPPGPLVWLHAASVGEAQSALSLIERMLAGWDALHVLVTTGTVTSAQLLGERLPNRSFHQFVPLDRVAWVRRFLEHWRPDLTLWMESDLWPNLLRESVRRGRPLVLVNGRMSRRSFERWLRARSFARCLLRGFALCLAQTDEQAERLRRLGAQRVKCVGNLKYSAAPLPVEEAELRRLRAACAGRPVWLAASTHPEEEPLVAEAHRMLATRFPGLLTVIVPRHPTRGPEIASMLAGAGLRLARRGVGSLPKPKDDIYLADTLGELGLFYRLVEIAFIGGSNGSHGGHNPLEAAQLGCAVLHGPDMANFRSVAEALRAAGAACEVDGAAALAQAVGRLLENPDARARQIAAARRVAAENRDVVERVIDELRPFLDSLAAERDDARA